MSRRRVLPLRGGPRIRVGARTQAASSGTGRGSSQGASGGGWRPWWTVTGTQARWRRVAPTPQHVAASPGAYAWVRQAASAASLATNRPWVCQQAGTALPGAWSRATQAARSASVGASWAAERHSRSQGIGGGSVQWASTMATKVAGADAAGGRSRGQRRRHRGYPDPRRQHHRVGHRGADPRHPLGRGRPQPGLGRRPGCQDGGLLRVCAAAPAGTGSGARRGDRDGGRPGSASTRARTPGAGRSRAARPPSGPPPPVHRSRFVPPSPPVRRSAAARPLPPRPGRQPRAVGWDGSHVPPPASGRGCPRVTASSRGARRRRPSPSGC